MRAKYNRYLKKKRKLRDTEYKIKATSLAHEYRHGAKVQQWSPRYKLPQYRTFQYKMLEYHEWYRPTSIINLNHLEPVFFAPLCEDPDMCRDADMCEDPDDYGTYLHTYILTTVFW